MPWSRVLARWGWDSVPAPGKPARRWCSWLACPRTAKSPTILHPQQDQQSGAAGYVDSAASGILPLCGCAVGSRQANGCSRSPVMIRTPVLS